MAIRTNARLLVAEVGPRVSDEAHLVWTESEILQQADGVLNRLWSKLRSGNTEHRLAEEVIAISDFAVLDGAVGRMRSYVLPEHVGAFRVLELRSSAGGRLPLTKTPLEGRYDNLSRGVVYHRGADGTVVLEGSVSGWDSLAIQHILKWPPLHYGVVQAGVTGTSMTLQQEDGVQAFGRAVRRSSLYAGTAIEFNTGAQADAVVTVASNVGGLVTWAPTLAPAPSPGDEYAIVVPLEGQHSEYFRELVVEAILTRDGQVQRLASMQKTMAMLEHEFRQDITQRDQDGPKRVMAVRRRL